MRKYALFGIVAAVVIGIAAVFAVNKQSSAPQAVPGEQHVPDPLTAQGQLYTHIDEGTPIQYDSYPPVFGNHYPTPKAWQAYDSPVLEGYFVHNLEHGGIVALYHCPSGCPDVVNQLKNLYTTLPQDKFNEVKLLVSPYDKETHQIAMLAWDYRLEMDTLDLNLVKAFYLAHVDRGPELIP